MLWAVECWRVRVQGEVLGAGSVGAGAFVIGEPDCVLTASRAAAAARAGPPIVTLGFLSEGPSVSVCDCEQVCASFLSRV
mmetsp:Transcript_17332/g.47721  ORF Transcript_17332/g.47721 Transcript_17332/m.47721 type:complete len:80 (-) Transcript_17332:178-417(-)